MDVRFEKALKLMVGIENGILGEDSLQEFVRRRKPMEPISLLDIGCAQDPFPAPEGWVRVGMDIKKGEDIVEGDINKAFPFRDDCFDVVFCGEVIEHAVDDDHFLRECKRVLKPGGYLILTTPNLVSLKNRFLMLLGKEPRFAYQRYHLHVYTLKEIKKIVGAFFDLKFIGGSYILYSSNFRVWCPKHLRPLVAKRNRFGGKFFEWLADRLPQYGEHFILLCRKA